MKFGWNSNQREPPKGGVKSRRLRNSCKMLWIPMTCFDDLFLKSSQIWICFRYYLNPNTNLWISDVNSFNLQVMGFNATLGIPVKSSEFLRNRIECSGLLMCWCSSDWKYKFLWNSRNSYECQMFPKHYQDFLWNPLRKFQKNLAIFF